MVVVAVKKCRKILDETFAVRQAAIKFDVLSVIIGADVKMVIGGGKSSF